MSPFISRDFYIVKFDTFNSLELKTAETIVSKLQVEAKDRYNLTGVFNQQIEYAGLPPKAQGLFQMVPVFFPLTVFAIASLTSVQSVVGDIPKSRILMTPASKFDVITSKVISNEIFIIVQCAFFTGLAYGMGLETNGSPVVLFAILAFIGLAGVCFGVAISTIVNTPLSALQLFIFVFMFQFIIMLFYQDPRVLSIFPMYNGFQLTMDQILRGENFWLTGIGPFLYTRQLYPPLIARERGAGFDWRSGLS